MTSVSFNGTDLYNEYGLILADRSMGSPTANRVTISINGRDGVLDVTSALYGRSAYYSNRTISLKFITTDHISGKTQHELYEAVFNEFHGRSVSVVFSDDTSHTWNGFATVEATSKDQKRTITITIDADPYKVDADGNKTF